MGGTHLALALRREASQAGRLRAHVRRACGAFPREVTDTAELLTTELFSNALMHGSGPIRVNVMVDDCLVRVEVSDSSPRAPVVTSPGTSDVHGRGMMLVEGLAHEWGVTNLPHSCGKVVWFTLKNAA